MFNSKLARLFDQTIPQLGYNLNGAGARVGRDRRATHCYADKGGGSSAGGTQQDAMAA